MDKTTEKISGGVLDWVGKGGEGISGRATVVEVEGMTSEKASSAMKEEESPPIVLVHNSNSKASPQQIRRVGRKNSTLRKKRRACVGVTLKNSSQGGVGHLPNSFTDFTVSGNYPIEGGNPLPIFGNGAGACSGIIAGAGWEGNGGGDSFGGTVDCAKIANHLSSGKGLFLFTALSNAVNADLKENYPKKINDDTAISLSTSQLENKQKTRRLGTQSISFSSELQGGNVSEFELKKYQQVGDINSIFLPFANQKSFNEEQYLFVRMATCCEVSDDPEMMALLWESHVLVTKQGKELGIDVQVPTSIQEAIEIILTSAWQLDLLNERTMKLLSLYVKHSILPLMSTHASIGSNLFFSKPHYDDWKSECSHHSDGKLMSVDVVDECETIVSQMQKGKRELVRMPDITEKFLPSKRCVNNVASRARRNKRAKRQKTIDVEDVEDVELEGIEVAGIISGTINTQVYEQSESKEEHEAPKKIYSEKKIRANIKEIKKSSKRYKHSARTQQQRKQATPLKERKVEGQIIGRKRNDIRLSSRRNLQTKINLQLEKDAKHLHQSPTSSLNNESLVDTHHQEGLRQALRQILWTRQLFRLPSCCLAAAIRANRRCPPPCHHFGRLSLQDYRSARGRVQHCQEQDEAREQSGVNIIVKSVSGEKITTISIETDQLHTVTIDQLLSKIETDTGILLEGARLLHGKYQLVSGRFLSDYGITDEKNIVLFLFCSSPRGGVRTHSKLRKRRHVPTPAPPASLGDGDTSLVAVDSQSAEEDTSLVAGDSQSAEGVAENAAERGGEEEEEKPTTTQPGIEATRFDDDDDDKSSVGSDECYEVLDEKGRSATVLRNQGGGDCLFHAIQQILRLRFDHIVPNIREDVFAHTVTNLDQPLEEASVGDRTIRQWIEFFVTNPDEATGEFVEDPMSAAKSLVGYISLMSEGGTYTGDFPLILVNHWLMHTFSLTLDVSLLEGKRVKRSYRFSKTGYNDTVTVAFNGRDHYEAIIYDSGSSIGGGLTVDLGDSDTTQLFRSKIATVPSRKVSLSPVQTSSSSVSKHRQSKKQKQDDDDDSVDTAILYARAANSQDESVFDFVRRIGLDKTTCTSDDDSCSGSSDVGIDFDLIDKVIALDWNPELDFHPTNSPTSNLWEELKGQKDDLTRFQTLSQIFPLCRQQCANARGEVELLKKNSTLKGKEKKAVVKDRQHEQAKANVELVATINFMHECIEKLECGGHDVSEQISCYREFSQQAYHETAVHTFESQYNVVGFLDKLFIGNKFLSRTEEYMGIGASGNDYKDILQERLQLLETYSQKGKSTESAESFRQKWEILDEKERKVVENIKCVEDMTKMETKVDKSTGEKTKVPILVIGKGNSWKYHNMGGIKSSASSIIQMNYHPPKIEDDGRADWGNGCVTANTRFVPTVIQRSNGGPLNDDERLTEESKDSIDESLTITDFYTFFPKSKDYYQDEAKLFSRSAGIELDDLRLSGILQLAGQAMSTHLEGRLLHIAVASAHVFDTAYDINGAAVSEFCIHAGRLPHGECLCRAKQYMTATSFSDEKLQMFSVTANIVFTPISSIVTGYDLETFMVIAQRSPMSAGEMALLKEQQSKFGRMSYTATVQSIAEELGISIDEAKTEFGRMGYTAAVQKIAEELGISIDKAKSEFSRMGYTATVQKIAEELGISIDEAKSEFGRMGYVATVQSIAEELGISIDEAKSEFSRMGYVAAVQKIAEELGISIDEAKSEFSRMGYVATVQKIAEELGISFDEAKSEFSRMGYVATVQKIAKEKGISIDEAKSEFGRMGGLVARGMNLSDLVGWESDFLTALRGSTIEDKRDAIVKLPHIAELRSQITSLKYGGYSKKSTFSFRPPEHWKKENREAPKQQHIVVSPNNDVLVESLKVAIHALLSAMEKDAIYGQMDWSSITAILRDIFCPGSEVLNHFAVVTALRGSTNEDKRDAIIKLPHIAELRSQITSLKFGGDSKKSTFSFRPPEHWKKENREAPTRQHIVVSPNNDVLVESLKVAIRTLLSAMEKDAIYGRMNWSSIKVLFMSFFME